LTMENDITFNAGQLFDGEDVSALAADLANQCTTAEAHAYVEANALTLTEDLTMNGNIIKMGAQYIEDASSYRLDAGDGNGIQFWNSRAYAIYMSEVSDGTYGGKVDDTSDFNMYFNMEGGTNRGFQFCSGELNPYFSINPDGIWSDVPIHFDVETTYGNFEIVYNAGSDSLDFNYIG